VCNRNDSPIKQQASRKNSRKELVNMKFGSTKLNTIKQRQISIGIGQHILEQRLN